MRTDRRTSTRPWSHISTAASEIEFSARPTELSTKQNSPFAACRNDGRHRGQTRYKEKAARRRLSSLRCPLITPVSMLASICADEPRTRVSRFGEIRNRSGQIRIVDELKAAFAAAAASCGIHGVGGIIDEGVS